MSNIKKITFLSLLFVIMSSFSVQALTWAINFVVWEGKVYEVKQEDVIENDKIGKVLGEVKTQPDGNSGDYHGNASNIYPIGTKYYEIKGISTSSAIAVKENDYWVKCVYVHKAPFHIMNILTNPFFIFSIVIIALILLGVIFRNKKSRTQKNI